jgi:hypothetical protein
MAKQNEIIDLYLKERLYETSVFGEYRSQKALNLASFLTFIEQYIRKAREKYCGPWQSDKPPWLKDCIELEDGQFAPIGAYEELIKIFALSGAALETYTEIDVEEWRKEGVKKKWRER